MQTLPSGYSSQPVTLDDVPRITQFGNADARRFTGRDVMSEERMEIKLSAPNMNLVDSARLILDPGGSPAAAGLVFHRDPHVTIHAWGLVGEEHRKLGLGRWIHDWILKRSQTAIERAPTGARVVIRQHTFDGDTTAEAFLGNAGYTRTRNYWRMAIELDTAPPPPEWPTEFNVATVDPERDLEAIVHASRDAFQDHYGMVFGSFEAEVERTRRWIEQDPNFDPLLQFLVRAGDEIAGFCFCASNEAGDDTIGYVQALGVRPAWRRRGLGRALLFRAFGEFHHRGKARAVLHVDAESLTGANRLYETVGMRVAELTHEYELELRPGADLTMKPASG